MLGSSQHGLTHTVLFSYSRKKNWGEYLIILGDITLVSGVLTSGDTTLGGLDRLPLEALLQLPGWDASPVQCRVTPPPPPPTPESITTACFRPQDSNLQGS